MILNAIYGIITAKACGIQEPTVGILNVDGARACETALRQLQQAGYPIRFAESVRADGGAARMSVQDEGQGIGAESLPHIFDRFFRTDESRARQTGGTGLGLSIVQDTARRHGGTVKAQRREPEGTCFEVSFAQWNGEEVGR